MKIAGSTDIADQVAHWALIEMSIKSIYECFSFMFEDSGRSEAEKNQLND